MTETRTISQEHFQDFFSLSFFLLLAWTSRENPSTPLEKKCYEINKITKIEGDLLKTNEDGAPQSRESFSA